MLKSVAASVILTASVCGAAGCAAQDEGEAFITNVLALTGPGCLVQSGNDSVSTALLDIGLDAGSANNLILPVNVVTNLPSTFNSTQAGSDITRQPNYPNYGNTDSNVITFNTSEVFFTTDEDRDNDPRLGQAAGTPVSRNNERQTGVAGVAFNEQTTLLSASVVTATVITKGDAGFLQTEPFVANAITSGGFAHIIVNIRLAGTTTGGAKIETPVFPFPVDLCEGCLTTPPACTDDKGTADPADDVTVAAIPNDAVCVNGNNVQSFVCP